MSRALSPVVASDERASENPVIINVLTSALTLINPLSSSFIKEKRDRRAGPASPRKLRPTGCKKRRMFEKGCERCRKWQEHYYWEHMDVSKIRFFKLMTGDFAKSISIPEKFTRNFNGHITNELDLKAPNGEIWHIGIDRHADELFLTSGWEDFVKAQDLQDNDLIVFTCTGKTSFEVLIFEAGGCEKVSSLFANRTGPNMCKRFNKVGQHAEHYSLSSDDTSMSSQPVGSPHRASTSKKSSGKTKSRKETESPNSSSYDIKNEVTMEQDESDDIYADCKYYYSRAANRLTDEDKEEILRLAPVRPNNPAFVIVVQKNHCRRSNNTMIIPSRFAADHLEARSQVIILLRPNRRQNWTVRYYTSYHRCFQNSPFFKFMHENKLREGDICVFELMKAGKQATMIVHVIRKSKGRFVLIVIGKMALAQHNCESCSKWQKHYYKQHMELSRTRFFKLMTGDFAQRISIPENFQNNLKGQITKGFNLKAPSGQTWRVGVRKDANELFFMSGWGDFASANELQENDFLIFTRRGNYSFDVLIFDSSGCEKVQCFFTAKKHPCMHKHSENTAGQQAERCILSDSDDSNTSLRLNESTHKASTSKKMRGQIKPRKEFEFPNSSNYKIKREAIDDAEQSNIWHADSNYYYSRSANSLTGDEREEIFSLVSIQPGNPAFVTVLQKSHVGRKNNMLVIHHEFAAEHLEGRSHDILLLRPNRAEKWYVKYYHGKDTRGFNCRRWVKFVCDNGLRKDYICVFELIKGAKKSTMIVHIIKKVGGRFVLKG
ncbi:hypothetical protein ACP4OV_022884 [Aristida adscensionis]